MFRHLVLNNINSFLHMLDFLNELPGVNINQSIMFDDIGKCVSKQHLQNEINMHDICMYSCILVIYSK